MQGFRVASVYRPDTGEVVQLNNIVAESTAYQGQSHEDGPEGVHGGRYESGSRHEFTIRFTGHTEGQALVAWQRANVGVRCVAIAAAPGGRNVQWYETTRMLYCRPVEIAGSAKGRADVYELRLVHEHPRAAVYSNVNLLAYLGWADANADGAIDGYALSAGAATLSIVSARQRVAASTGVVVLDTTIELPVSGVTLTVSENFNALHAAANNGQGVSALSFASATLATADANTFATGVKSTSVATVAGTYKIAVRIVRLTSITAAGSADVDQVTLRVDGLSTYTPY